MKSSAAGPVVTLRPNGQLTLPAAIRRRVHAQAGDVFLAEVTDDAIVLRPRRLVDASQAYFWTAEWQKAEREASADVAAGRLKRSKRVADLIRDLDR
jgi:AbrB family looped-hinge helix DNA binding protein